MIIANRPLNRQAIILEEAENEIRIVVKEEYFRLSAKRSIDLRVFKIIKEAAEKIELPVLKNAAEKSLLHFYNRQYAEIQRLNGADLMILLALGKLSDSNVSASQEAEARATLVDYGVDKSNLYGNALQKYSKDYIERNVKPVIDRLTKQFPLDPGDISGRNSLRNRAEMEVRYQGHIDEIADFKAKGTRLVVASTHADCSERCRPWQGRVYSLDGTSGVTDDGRKYVPLEQATDVWYTTKAGKSYKNGLLGFNCRHYLVPYVSGYRFPKPNAAEERKQYAITVKQRELERNVIKWKTEALESKGVDRERFLSARKKAVEWNKKYIAYSKEHGRAYYPSRTKLL